LSHARNVPTTAISGPDEGAFDWLEKLARFLNDDPDRPVKARLSHSLDNSGHNTVLDAF
jgi:hypothetical protein